MAALDHPVIQGADNSVFTPERPRLKARLKGGPNVRSFVDVVKKGRVIYGDQRPIN